MERSNEDENKSLFKLLRGCFFFFMLMYNYSKVILSYSSTNLCKYGASFVYSWTLSQPGLPRESHHNVNSKYVFSGSQE